MVPPSPTSGSRAFICSVKQPGREVQHSSLSSYGSENVWSHTTTYIWFAEGQLKFNVIREIKRTMSRAGYGRRRQQTPSAKEGSRSRSLSLS